MEPGNDPIYDIADQPLLIAIRKEDFSVDVTETEDCNDEVKIITAVLAFIDLDQHVIFVDDFFLNSFDGPMSKTIQSVVLPRSYDYIAIRKLHSSLPMLQVMSPLSFVHIMLRVIMAAFFPLPESMSVS